MIIIAALTVTASAGFMCRACNGTGWRNSVKCIHCGGDGES